MAKADVIATSLSSVEDAVAGFDRLLGVFMEGGEVPSWVLVVHDSFKPVVQSLGVLGRDVRRDVLPYLQDLDHAKLRGGMGAVAPMATKVIAGQSAPSRK